MLRYSLWNCALRSFSFFLARVLPPTVLVAAVVAVVAVDAGVVTGRSSNAPEASNSTLPSCMARALASRILFRTVCTLVDRIPPPNRWNETVPKSNPRWQCSRIHAIEYSPLIRKLVISW
eukprot:Pompholyxophrys_punicea_v1_NODE_103_length_3477_cov_5.215371.p7 type:complete len:120 gc:universal NODE_103_length_3477_cov_5.215371:2607-2248(-)